MKIMMVITGMNSGGAERVMATLCNQLVNNHNVRLVTMKDAISDYYIADDVEFIGGSISNRSLWKSVTFVKKQMEEWKPDIVLAFMTKGNIIALLAKIFSKHKSPVVIAERANPYYTGRLYKIIRKFLYPMASGFVFQTKQAQDYYKEIIKCESIVLNNPLNEDFRVETYKGVKRNRIVTVGRLSQEKNQKLLIDAFRQIADKYPTYSVEIYGDGSLHDILEQYIIECKLQDRVVLQGRKSKVHEHIKDAEIFVLPSNSEGMPNALIEAMALGLSCIATDCPIGGSACIVDNEENGLLVPMNDVDSMANAIERLIVDKELAEKFSNEARKIVEKFDSKKVCAEWEKYLLKILE